MPSSCKDIRAELASCLQQSDCVLIHRNTPTECMKAPLSETLPTRCQQLKLGYSQCRRGWLDMRKRFRGNQPFPVSREFESEKPEQLYAGGRAVGDAGIAGVEKAEGDLVEGADGELRAKR